MYVCNIFCNLKNRYVLLFGKFNVMYKMNYFIFCGVFLRKVVLI